MSTGALVCCTMLSGQFLQPVLRAISLRTEREATAHLRGQLQQLLALPVVKRNTDPTPAVKGAVHFDHVFLHQKGQEQALLRDLHLSVTAGSVIGLASHDGLGRTAILKLVLGDILPTSGHVIIDGIATTDNTFANMRKAIAYVGPKPAIFRGTILDNLTSFQPQSRNFARQMAALADLEEAVHKLPNGYDTMVGESIDEIIPASIAQLITIVRALTTGARLLLLDESSAILDRHAEHALIAAIAKLRGKLTLIIATHRPSILAKADVVYTLTDGQLVEPAGAMPFAIGVA
jgi:ATP-binding cassette, subfamily C, bacterial LapB